MNEYYNEEVPMYLRRAFSDEVEDQENENLDELNQDEPAGDDEVADSTDEAIQDVVDDATNQVSEQKVQAMFSQLFRNELATRLYSEVLESEDSDLDIDVDSIADETADRVMNHLANEAADEIYPEVREAIADRLSQNTQSYYDSLMYADGSSFDGEDLVDDEEPYEDDTDYSDDDSDITDHIADIDPEQVTQSLMEDAYLLGRQQAFEEIGFEQAQYSLGNKFKSVAERVGKVGKVGKVGMGAVATAGLVYGGKKLYDKYKKNRSQSELDESYFDQNQQSVAPKLIAAGLAVGGGYYGYKKGKRIGKYDANKEDGIATGRDPRSRGLKKAAKIAGALVVNNAGIPYVIGREIGKEVGYSRNKKHSELDEAYELGRQQAYEEFSTNMYSELPEDETIIYSQNQQADVSSLEDSVNTIINKGSTKLFTNANNSESLESNVLGLLK